MTINEVVICGRLTKDPELRYTQNNVPVASFTVALDRYMGKDKKNETDFINCVAWNSNAEMVGKYFFKGKKILIKGNLRQRTWDDEEGKKHYVTEVWVEKLDFADDKKKEGGNSSSSNGNSGTFSGFIPIDGDDDLPF
jgi:single-strand DNA-binding protein